ncbi:uncharacterized protein LOC130625821 [Hydractinia symbiolongicarpus]|uniref:uncharacterized protein LOC130625821 n=1 Tax=Hydractinia symbiolongicarpus TaxID=13093 RepID=UPI00254D89A8|nr:uncharacterized protein LOC130625821 [Hydractinia symbiolongicarpus]
MAARSARFLFRGGSVANSFLKSSNGNAKLCTSSNLARLVKGANSNSLKSRCLSQFLPALHVQAGCKFGITPLGALNLLEKSFASKQHALTLAINESEVTSVEESDEDDEATLYILSEMFSTIWACDDVG